MLVRSNMSRPDPNAPPTTADRRQPSPSFPERCPSRSKAHRLVPAPADTKRTLSAAQHPRIRQVHSQPGGIPPHHLGQHVQQRRSPAGIQPLPLHWISLAGGRTTARRRTRMSQQRYLPVRRFGANLTRAASTISSNTTFLLQSITSPNIAAYKAHDSVLVFRKLLNPTWYSHTTQWMSSK